MEKSSIKCAPDASLILILANNPKHSLRAKNHFQNKIFWERIIKKPLKS